MTMALPRGKKRGLEAKGALELVDSAIHVLRTAPASVLLTYLAGTLPFVLGLLYFVADMSRSSAAEDYCAPAAAGLAALFLWMKMLQAVFARKIEAFLAPGDRVALDFKRLVFLAASQSLVHASGFLAIPIGLLAMFPLAWIYAFYQNATVLALSDSIWRSGNTGVKRLARVCWNEAMRAPGQNHLLLLVLSVFGLLVLANVASAILTLPYLAKSLLGIETDFTLSGMAVLNTTFLAAVCGLTYLCVDPVVKTIYVLRCFYGLGLASGKDLTSELARLRENTPSSSSTAAQDRSESRPRIGGKALLTMALPVLMAATFFALPSAGQASDIARAQTSAEGATVPSDQLEHAIQEVLQQPEFTWRLPKKPREKDESEKKGALHSLFKWIADTLKPPVKAVLEWLGKFFDWLAKRSPERSAPHSDRDSSWRGWVRGGMIALLVLVLLLLVRLFIKSRKAGQTVVEASAVSATAPDVSDDDVAADDFPENRWVEAGLAFMESGELKMSLRAFFFATLSTLSDAGLVAVAKHKSNMEYRSELDRRAHDRGELCEIFATRAEFFDRVRYGRHPLTLEELKRYAAEQERLAALC